MAIITQIITWVEGHPGEAHETKVYKLASWVEPIPIVLLRLKPELWYDGLRKDNTVDRTVPNDAPYLLRYHVQMAVDDIELWRAKGKSRKLGA